MSFGKKKVFFGLKVDINLQNMSNFVVFLCAACLPCLPSSLIMHVPISELHAQ